MNQKQTRLQVLERQVARLERRLQYFKSVSDRFSLIRLAVFLGALPFIAFAFYFGGWLVGLVATVLFLVGFGVLVYFHRKLDLTIARHQLWRRLKITQIARINLDWQNIPPAPPPDLSRRDHPFELDLDITGERSIHRLLNTAISQQGGLRLQEWLLTTHPEIKTILYRQRLVRELISLSKFRDELLLVTNLSRGNLTESLDGQKLMHWLSQQKEEKPLGKTIAILSVLAGLNIILLALAWFGILPGVWLLSFAAYVILYNMRAGDTGDIYTGAYTLQDGLEQLKSVLNYLETYKYRKNVALKELCAPLLDPKNRPSAILRRLSGVLIGIALQRNAPLWLVINTIVPWRFYFAYLFNQRKHEVAAHLPDWLEVWYELEALNSLANFGYINPEYTMPVVESSNGKIIFEGIQLGHPLIPAEQKVCNDFRLDDKDVIIITGSNMAGKSSFLRTLGLNLSLAYTGAPINAERLHVGLFRLFTCIKVSDSVTDGFSYFYAEVRRLKALLNEVETPDPMPVFYLIDEIFRGTNNRERLIGSQSFLRALVGRNCVGAISTHDLELVKLADDTPGIINYHFREEVIEGRMVFDYRLRTGPSPTTNALVIMRMEGLPVPDFANPRN